MVCTVANYGKPLSFNLCLLRTNWARRIYILLLLLSGRHYWLLHSAHRCFKHLRPRPRRVFSSFRYHCGTTDHGTLPPAHLLFPPRPDDRRSQLCLVDSVLRNTDSNHTQLKNSVIETDVVSLAAKTGSVDNYAGNGFTIESRTIQTEGEGARAYDAVKDRRYVH